MTTGISGFIYYNLQFVVTTCGDRILAVKDAKEYELN